MSEEEAAGVPPDSADSAMVETAVTATVMAQPRRVTTGHRGNGFLVLVVLIAVGAVILYATLGNPDGLEVNLGYLVLALVGVSFHVAKKHREVRDEDGFDWQEYWPDYLFRALQAGVYIIVIQNLVLEPTGPDGSLVSTALPSVGLAVIALFVGMFIRQVERVFEEVGERFGDMLTGVLGTAVSRLSPPERRGEIEATRQKVLELRRVYNSVKAGVEADARASAEGLFKEATELLQKGKVDAARSRVNDLELALTDLSAM